MNKSLSALAAVLSVASPLAAFAQTSATSLPPAPYSVFVDQPTGFTFVKLPGGWKFAGAVSKEEPKRLPANVLTSVLLADYTQPAPQFPVPRTSRNPIWRVLSTAPASAA